MIFLNIAPDFIYKAFQQLCLGVVQGLTEFLPISSTAHLIVVPSLFGWQQPDLTNIASIQLGSVFAVLIYFRKDLAEILKGFYLLFFKSNYTDPKSKLSAAIFLGNIPIILIGLFIKLFWNGYETSFLRTIPAIAVVSVVMAIALAFAEKIGRRFRNLDNLTIRDGIFIGFSQTLALIPGVSRSGITITSSLISGFNRSSSARFSFLLGIPAITLAGLVEFNQAMIEFSNETLFLLVIGIISSSITSWVAIDFLINYLKRYSTSVFIYYRLMFGIFILIWYYQMLLN
tara:strand:- start:319 stop:1179 length:861 start_codon:yes stop_codon:yes gene_type:complete